MSSVLEALHETHAANGIHRPGCKLCEPHAVHYVELTAAEPDIHGNRDAPTLKFECRGNASSECHQYPDNCGCESFPCGHPYVAHAECWMQAWFDGDCASYEGEDGDHMEQGGLPRDVTKAGPISTSWEDDYVAWEWVA